MIKMKHCIFDLSIKKEYDNFLKWINTKLSNFNYYQRKNKILASNIVLSNNQIKVLINDLN